MIPAVQTESYNKGKFTPLNINIVPVGSGAKINIDYVTPQVVYRQSMRLKVSFARPLRRRRIMLVALQQTLVQ